MKKILATALLLPNLALAHTGVGDTSGFSHGFIHPFTGLDHLLVMLVVGIWAFQIGGRALYALPLAFVGVMVAGSLWGMSSPPVSFVEGGIALSVLVAGLLLLTGARLAVSIGLVVAGLFAVFHGFAHGMEIPSLSNAAQYITGFAAATAMIHGVGIGLGKLFQQTSPVVQGLAGVAVSMVGGSYLLGMMA
jgi:urease accessory protein